MTLVPRSKMRSSPARRGTAWAHTRAPLASERRDEVRKVVLETAYQLYASEGYGGVTMRALAEGLRCAPTAVYRYFRSKEEIVLALKAAASALMASSGAIPETDDPVADLRAVYWRYYTFSGAHPVYFRLLWADASTPPYDPQAPEFEGLLRLGQEARQKALRCVEAGHFPGDTDVVALLGALWCSVHGAAAFRSIGAMRGADFDRIASTGLDLVIAGARSTRGAQAVPATSAAIPNSSPHTR